MDFVLPGSRLRAEGDSGQGENRRRRKRRGKLERERLSPLLPGGASSRVESNPQARNRSRILPRSKPWQREDGGLACIRL